MLLSALVRLLHIIWMWPASPEPQWYCLPRADTTTARNFCQASWASAVKTEGPNLAATQMLMHSARSWEGERQGCINRTDQRTVRVSVGRVRDGHLPWSYQDPRGAYQSASCSVRSRHSWCCPSSSQLSPAHPSLSCHAWRRSRFPGWRRWWTGRQSLWSVSVSTDTQSKAWNDHNTEIEERHNGQWHT